MSINANYFNTHTISSSHIAGIKEGDRKTATQMGLWDKFIDLFRSDKKQTALNALYDALHGEPKQRLEAFDLLRSCAKHADQSRFTKTIDDDGTLICRIDDTTITSFDSDAFKDVARQVQTAGDAASAISMMPTDRQLDILRKIEEHNHFKFLKTIDHDGILSVSLDGEEVGQFDLYEILSLGKENINLADLASTMLDAEKLLFCKILDADLEAKKQFKDIEQHKRDVHRQIATDIYALYRPEEIIDEALAACVHANSDEKLEGLECLNTNMKDWITQFGKVGYHANQAKNAIEFNMVHPLISYALGTYANLEAIAGHALEDEHREIAIGRTTSLLNNLKNGYDSYRENKHQIDQKLEELYRQHGGTLAIVFDSRCQNRLTFI